MVYFAQPLSAQRDAGLADPSSTRAEMERAQRAARSAGERGERLTERARKATEAAEKTATEAAAIAARIQQAEAGMAAADARIALIGGQRARLDARLAERQEPIVRLTAALQNMARRPLVLSALRPGSLKDTVYLRAVLETTIPQIRTRTTALRSELAKGRELESQARQARSALSTSETQLAAKTRELANLETKQRIASRRANSLASREAERALALAEEARDLDSLVGELDRASALRRELAALSGPIIRPPRPGASQVIEDASPAPTPSATGAPADLQLPVSGRTVAGFGAIDANGVASDGIALAPVSGAQVVAPAAGRVAFAGPYRGFGRIVIIEHGSGWTSLVTGLARSDVVVGERLVAGSPLGVAAGNDPTVTLELRRDGTAVNPLRFME